MSEALKSKMVQAWRDHASANDLPAKGVRRERELIAFLNGFKSAVLFAYGAESPAFISVSTLCFFASIRGESALTLGQTKVSA